MHTTEEQGTRTHVAWLDVAVHDAHAMQVRHGRRNLHQRQQHPGQRYKGRVKGMLCCVVSVQVGHGRRDLHQRQQQPGKRYRVYVKGVMCSGA